MSDAPASPPSFDQLPTLAHMETDRFCDKCAYNLRGQPVRRDLSTQLILCRCPECGTYQPANNAAGALRPWLHRFTIVLIAIWLAFIVFLIGWSAGGQFAVMGTTVEELGRLQWRENYNYYPGATRTFSTITPQADLDRRAREATVLRVFAILGSAAIGFISITIWTIVFPHWKRWGYRAMAVIVPLLGLIGVCLLVYFEEVRRIPDEWLLILLAMFAAHAAAGILASYTGRAVTRGILMIMLPARPRALFSYLWLADGKNPPHAK